MKEDLKKEYCPSCKKFLFHPEEISLLKISSVRCEYCEKSHNYDFSNHEWTNKPVSDDDGYGRGKIIWKNPNI